MASTQAAVAATANSKAQTIVDLCEQHWDANTRNCSGFVKSVAADLGIQLTGQANSIIDQMQRSPWRILASGLEARRRAANGALVLGGLKADPHGHVVIVVDGPLSHGKYPTAYWGSLGGVAKKNTTINWSWVAADRDNVIYVCREW